MIRAYKYRLYPNKKQIQKLEWTLDICHLLYNSCLLDRKNHYERNKKGLSRIKQQEILKLDKIDIKYLNEIHSQVLQDVLIRLDKAFQSFFRRVKNSKKPGYPRFKGENRYDSITYPQQPGFKIGANNIHLSKIGNVKIKLHRPIQGLVKTCTITRDIDRWYACFSVKYEPIVPKIKPIKAIGIDVGLKSFAVLSDGKSIKNPRYLRKSEKMLAKKQRVLSRRKKKSRSRNRARLVVAKIHRIIREQRKDFHHKISRQLVNSFGFIVVENLNIKGMVRNHRLAKSISDAAWGQFLNFIQYKAEEAGIEFERVVPQNTSIICSTCGEKVPKTLATRIHKCPHCNVILDRDHNAAINILHKSTAGTAESYAWGECSHQDASLNQEILSNL